MTETHPTPARHSRRGLAIPFIIVGLLLAAWSGWWFYLVDQIETRLATQVESLRQDGWTITQAPVTTTGWPFRTRVSIPQADILLPSGHGIAAPELVAEAGAWNPDHWVVIAPEGMTLIRADKGRIAIGGDGLRFSISQLRARFPDLRAEMIRPTFTALAGAEPFPIASAERIQLETRPHLTDGQASTDALDVLFRLVGARGRPGGPVEGATRQGRLSADVEGTIVGASQLQAMDSAGLFSAWTKAGGRFTGVRGRLKAGDSTALISSETLSARADGRLEGTLSVRAEKPMDTIAGLAGSSSGAVNRSGAAEAAAAAPASGEQPVDLVIQFRDGRTWLGPFALAPAPRLF